MDTVGFIRKLPHTLVEAFRSTLEEAVLADVLILVSDGSSRDMMKQHDTVEEVLNELGATEQKRIEVINKCDLAEPDYRIPGAVLVSAKTRDGLPDLERAIANAIQTAYTPVTVFLPFSQYGEIARIRAMGRVLAENYTDEGTLLTVMLSEEDRKLLILRYGEAAVRPVSGGEH